MIKALAAFAPFALTLASCATAEQAATAPSATAASNGPSVGAISAADPRAQAAGEEILAKGGSATDAAIAVMLALTVVEPQSSGIGGGGFMVRAKGTSIDSFDGRETAPAAATPRRFLDDDSEVLPRGTRVTSGLSVGVPGNIALAEAAHAQYGKLEWAELFQPAIRLARDGFTMNKRLNDSLDRHKGGRADKTASARAVFYDSAGQPLRVGATVRNPEFAATLEALASNGANYMYSDTAKALADYVADETPQDGTMTRADIAAYKAKTRVPVCTKYRAYRVCGMGPPSSGGIAVSQILGQLEQYDLAALGPDSPTFWHLFLESQRLAYADRGLYVGDADFVKVPVTGLIQSDYVKKRGGLISPDKAIAVAEPGVPKGAPQALAPGDRPYENGTTHFSVVDSEGAAVSYTSTIEGAFGSGLFFGGFYLNNELTDFSFRAEKDGKMVANRVEGGKRPRSSMAPTIVFDEEGEVFMVVGAAGGPTIPVQTARAIIGVIDFKLSATEAVGLPLIMAFGPTVVYEKGSKLKAMEETFRALGHTRIREFGASLKANALLRVRGADGSDTWEVARDPRIEPMLAYE